ncbi:hypothetical protein SRRS_13990 [Sporomusa rhizae]|uniref:acyloxyacyl hydrolase n=1 Tax=Sporomusa rhizae TaxID=357999 RepID=UPI00352B6E24
MRRLFWLVIIINFLLIVMPGNSYCYAADSKLEMEWDYLTPHKKNRDIDTVSLHILNKISETKNKTIYRGITITRSHGEIDYEHRILDSEGVGVGPIYMIRNERARSGKLSTALEMSGGFIVYDKVFPAGGRRYNFMWRVGPRFTYKFNENTSVNVGYMLMHVSNGFSSHNPGYDARGVSLGFVTKF